MVKEFEYRGYRVVVAWINKYVGFRFSVYNSEIKLVAKSEGKYFHDFNAENAAKKYIDEMLGEEAEENGKDI